MQYLITFMSTGGLYVEANSIEEAEKKFNDEMQEDAGRQLAYNGIEITDITWEKTKNTK